MVHALEDEKVRVFFLFSAVFFAGFTLWALGNLAVTGYVPLDTRPNITLVNATLNSTQNIQENFSASTAHQLNDINMSITCQESWICSNWNSCSRSKQTRSCSDKNICGTSDAKPSQEQDCILTLAPLRSINYVTLLLSLTALILVVFIITMYRLIIAQKKRLAGQLFQVISKANASLSLGDKASALNNYKILKHYLTKYQKKVSRKDFQRLHMEGMVLHENLSR